MADIRVKDLTEATVPGADYFLLTDSATDGVKKVKTTNVVTPAGIGAASLAGTETLTNKTIDGASNTLTNIPNSALTNAGVTVSGHAVALGGTLDLDPADLGAIADGTILANTTGALASASATTIAAVMDKQLGSTQGSIAYRGASAWSSLPPGILGQYLKTQGAGNNPIYDTPAGGGDMLKAIFDPTNQATDAFAFLQAGTGAASRTVQNRLREVISVKDFDVVGDGVADDYTNIIKARDAAIAADKALVFPDGSYAFGTTIEFAKSNLHVLAGGPRVTLLHTGTGRAISFDGSTDAATMTYNQTFGGAYRFNIVGNANTSDLLYTKQVHRSKFSANVRNGSCGWRNLTTVLNDYDIVCSSNEGAFTTTPFWGAFLEELYAARCYLILEGCGGSANYGFDLESGFNNTFYGSTEGCLSGGVYIGASATRNTFIGVDNEVNGTGKDWLIAGSGNTFINCTGSATNTGSEVSGNRNIFQGCHLEGMDVASGATSNEFNRCGLDTLTPTSVGFSDAGTSTVIQACTGPADKPSRSIPFSGSSGAATLAAGATEYIGYIMDATESNVYLSVGVPGTFKNLNIASSGSPGVGQSYALTVRKTLVDTSVTCSIFSGTNQASDLVNTVHFNAGDRLAIKAVSSAGAAATPLLWSLEFVPD